MREKLGLLPNNTYQNNFNCIKIQTKLKLNIRRKSRYLFVKTWGKKDLFK